MSAETTRTSIRPSVVSVDDKDSRQQHLLDGTSASSPYCCMELPTTASSASSVVAVQDAPVDFYLPLRSSVDDNPTITVYSEAKEMLLSAILMYGVVHLRTLARN